MIKPQMKVVIPAEIQQRLHQIGERYGMTGNAIVAAAAHELSRVRPENLWHALGRIAEGEAPELPAPAAKRIGGGRSGQRALPVSASSAD